MSPSLIEPQLTSCHRLQSGQAIQEFGARIGLGTSDLALWRRLSDPESADFILDHPDYVCLQVGLLAVGQKPP